MILTIKRVDGVITETYDLPSTTELNYLINDMKSELSTHFDIPENELVLIKGGEPELEYASPINNYSLPYFNMKLVDLWSPNDMFFYASSNRISISNGGIFNYFDNTINYNLANPTPSPSPIPDILYTSTNQTYNYPVPQPAPENQIETKIKISYFPIVETTQECPVCFENKDNCILPYGCKHTLCSDCFMDWDNKASTNNCPICRSDIDIPLLK
jgi:hypothetical protein